MLIAAIVSGSMALAAPDSGFFDDYCVTCHNDDTRVGNFSLEGVNPSDPARHAEDLEKVALKLRAGMMPPSGMPRPGPAEIARFASDLEEAIDRAAVADPNPGRPVLHRLNVWCERPVCLRLSCGSPR